MKNSPIFPKIFLQGFCMFIFIVYGCHESIIKKKSSLKHHEENKDLNIKFRGIIEDYIIQVESSQDFEPAFGKRHVYYSLKFFELHNNLYFTLRARDVFSSFYLNHEYYYDNDTSLMFYLKVENRNLVIIDFPESSGHGLFVKTDKRREMAMTAKQKFDSFVESRVNSVLRSSMVMPSVTYEIRNTLENPEFIQLDSIIEPPPYKSELQSSELWEIIDID